MAKKKFDPVPKYVRLARERQARDLKEAEKRGFVFDRAAGERVVHFFENYLVHWKGEWAGQPFVLEEWQAEEIIIPLFGWKRKDGTRRFRFAYVEVPKKNGKSPTAAGVGLYLLVGDQEPGAEVYSSATKRDQAKIVFEYAQKMVKKSPALRAELKVMRNNIHCLQLGSKFEPLGADSDTLDGLSPNGNLVDELHAHKDRNVMDTLITAAASRRQPLHFMITTAGVYKPEGVGYQEHEYAVRVLEGAIEDDEYFAWISCADEDDDWTDPRVWEKANPNWGVSVKPDYVSSLVEKAQRQPSFTNSVKRYHLGLWTEQKDRWLSMEKWKECAEPIVLSELRGRVCYGGLDLSSKIDISAFDLVFPPPEGEQIWKILPFFWVPRERILERAKKDRVPYARWVELGFMKATEGDVVDYDVIRDDIKLLRNTYSIQEIGADPWNATQLITQLMSDGFQVVEVPQNYGHMSESTKEFERLVVGRKMHHGGNPVLTWMASNVAIKEDDKENMMPSKKKSGDRIDGISSGIIAISRAQGGSAPATSKYETEEMTVVG